MMIKEFECKGVLERETWSWSKGAWHMTAPSYQIFGAWIIYINSISHWDPRRIGQQFPSNLMNDLNPAALLPFSRLD